ncbi:hypothetical protein O3M35_007488 [Rhynocoris fuscipes]|uniref:Uncharacterized protein n=1 Tax=Rhynocoris fuscipes TaxID=488301 RepID=A0AAW1DFB7_9HEMI
MAGLFYICIFTRYICISWSILRILGKEETEYNLRILIRRKNYGSISNINVTDSKLYFWNIISRNSIRNLCIWNSILGDSFI